MPRLKVASLVLMPLSWLYGLVVAVRNFLYDRGIIRAVGISVPVICVGNMTTGGTGKTPIVEYVVGILLRHGLKVGIVSRGYGRSTRGTVVVSDGRTVRAAAGEGGDEPVQMARKLPASVVVDERRARGAAAAIAEFGAQVIVLDDGFQHRSLRRDLDLVVVDADRPPHQTWLLPAGTRREPISGLRRAGAIVVSRWSDERGPAVSSFVRRLSGVPQFRATFPVLALVRVADGTRSPVNSARGMSCVAFCGIADPSRFKLTLEDLGVKVKAARFFSDHHSYTTKELDDLERAVADTQAGCLMTTEKDAVRLADGAQDFLSRCPVYYIEIGVRISDDEEFTQLILRTAKA